MIVSRRTVLLGSVTLAVLASTRAFASDIDAKLAELEKRSRGRLGVAIFDSGSGAYFSHRSDERFGLCSTFKFVAAAAVLHRVDKGLDTLDRLVPYSKADLIDYAPVTEQHVQEGAMTLGDLCAAAVELSDNTAGNLILKTIGGPAALTQFMRDLGDNTSRLDRTEPTLNLITKGDPRDTTTPAAMLGMMKALLLNDTLATTSRQQLLDWMLGCKTGSKRIAAGLPSGWRIGDKTGTGPKGEANDVAIIWPQEKAPVLVASYYEGPSHSPAERDAVHAEVGRIIAGKI
ncbi:MAG: class A beta-lactamase [Parvibaculaceae bacterium]